MTKIARGDGAGAHDVAFEVYGARARVAVPRPELVPRVVERFPRHAIRSEPRAGDRTFALEPVGDGRYAVVDDGVVSAESPTLESALALLGYELFYYAVHHARDRLIISAAVVGHEGRAIVLPGAPRAGKTVLMVALLRAGAVYYADDWGVLDAQGNVHPYPTNFRLDRRKVSAESLGAVTGDTPIPVVLVARTPFSEGGRWDVRARTPAEGTTILLGHAYGMDDPPAALQIAHSAASRALVIEGERGEADEAAAELLEIAAEAPMGDGDPPK